MLNSCRAQSRKMIDGAAVSSAFYHCAGLKSNVLV